MKNYVQKFFTLSLISQTALATTETPMHRILSFADNKAKSNLVIIDAGTTAGVVEGSFLESIRPLAKVQKLWIPTGRLEVIHTTESHAIAKIVEQDQETMALLFPDFPTTMAGDMVRVRKISVQESQMIVPTQTLWYTDLFVDPKSNPSTLELTEKGKELLTNHSESFANVRKSQLLITAHTDENGSSEVNRMESQERALAVRQFLISELGFDQDRLIALGLGEDDPKLDHSSKDQLFSPQKLRRITLKVLD